MADEDVTRAESGPRLNDLVPDFPSSADIDRIRCYLGLVADHVERAEHMLDGDLSDEPGLSPEMCVAVAVDLHGLLCEYGSMTDALSEGRALKLALMHSGREQALGPDGWIVTELSDGDPVQLWHVFAVATLMMGKRVAAALPAPFAVFPLSAAAVLVPAIIDVQPPRLSIETVTDVTETVALAGGMMFILGRVGMRDSTRAEATEKAAHKTKQKLSAWGTKGGHARALAAGDAMRREKVRAAWASGVYASKDECAHAVCGSVGVSFSTARKALRNLTWP